MTRPAAPSQTSPKRVCRNPKRLAPRSGSHRLTAASRIALPEMRPSSLRPRNGVTNLPPSSPQRLLQPPLLAPEPGARKPQPPDTPTSLLSLRKCGRQRKPSPPPIGGAWISMSPCATTKLSGSKSNCAPVKSMPPSGPTLRNSATHSKNPGRISPSKPANAVSSWRTQTCLPCSRLAGVRRAAQAGILIQSKIRRSIATGASLPGGAAKLNREPLKRSLPPRLPPLPAR